jgi:uncharacterized protein (DUF952 family)
MDNPYRPPSLAREGFIHCSFRDDVNESARLYFGPGAELRVLQIDPRELTDVRVVETPRGPMPHVHEPIPFVAVQRIWLVDQMPSAPDRIG